MSANLFGGLDSRQFLDAYWQKKPLLVRGAFPGIAAPLSRGELLDLACASRVDSRLIRAPGAGRGWSVERGPLTRAACDRLPAQGWTILIQEADRHVPACRALLERFRFVPNWRIDDVMVSFAADGGGVGPHVDRYDVFLLQASGRRRWRVGASTPGDTPLVPGIELSILAEFQTSAEWLLEPGDMLYLPPGVAHEGTAVGDCMTCSVGFRVPDPRELCASFLTQLGPHEFDAIRYEDPGLQPPSHLGEIAAAARRTLRNAARGLFEQRSFDDWVGRYVTRPLRARPQGAAGCASVEQLWRQLERGAILARSAPAHFAWYVDDDGGVQLFIGGENYPLGRERADEAELLCGRRPLDAATLAPYIKRPSFAAVLFDQVLRGYLIPTASGGGIGRSDA